MNAVSFRPELCDDDEVPATERAPASGLARLIDSMRAEPAEETLTRTPSIDLIALARGADEVDVGIMRALYARGEMDEALSVAASIRAATVTDNDTTDKDPFGGLILVVDEELVVDDADIEEIDNLFLHFD